MDPAALISQQHGGAPAGIFAVLAQERLVLSLREAFHYVLAVGASRFALAREGRLVRLEQALEDALVRGVARRV